MAHNPSGSVFMRCIPLHAFAALATLTACGDSSPDLLTGPPTGHTAMDGGTLPGTNDAAPGGPDGDGDGVADVLDNCRQAVNPDQADSDRDSLGDACDNCLTVSNFGQTDSDGDGRGDACQDTARDSDGDGVDDRVDRCPQAADPGQQDMDQDKRGDACDNCPTLANYNQLDSDGDRLGDVCAARLPDRDGDGVRDHLDNCRGAANTDQLDQDGDGIGDTCDNCANLANASQKDGDADGIGDQCDADLAMGASCASGTTQANPLKPNLYFLLDRSASMGPLPAGTAPPLRIDILKGALNTLAGSAQAPGALISNFNLGVGAFPFVDGSCASTVVPEQLLTMAERPAADAFNAFTGAYAAMQPAGYTPTDVALAQVRTLGLYNFGGDTSATRSKGVVLITDGVPNDCTTDQPNRLDQTVAEAGNLAAAGVPVFVLGFQGVNVNAMQRIADAGDPAPGTNPWYPVSDTNSIVAALNSIITRTASCSLPLADTGIGARDPAIITVELVRDGGATRSALPADAANGYTLDTSELLSLHGSACSDLQAALISDSAARVEVRMGCACVGGTEICFDDLDNDCDGRIDENCVPGDQCGVNAPPEQCETNIIGI